MSDIKGIASEYNEGSGVDEAELGMDAEAWAKLVNAELRRRYPLVDFVPAWEVGQAMTLSPGSRRVDDEIDYCSVIESDPATLAR